MSDVDMPIGLKRTREGTKHPLYMISNFVSFERCSGSYKNFVMSQNAMLIPNIASESLIVSNGKML